MLCTRQTDPMILELQFVLSFGILNQVLFGLWIDVLPHDLSSPAVLLYGTEYSYGILVRSTYPLLEISDMSMPRLLSLLLRYSK